MEKNPPADTASLPTDAAGLTRLLLRVSGWTQEQLAEELTEALDLHTTPNQSTISRWATGRRTPPKQVRIAMQWFIDDAFERASGGRLRIPAQWLMDDIFKQAPRATRGSHK